MTTKACNFELPLDTLSAEWVEELIPQEGETEPKKASKTVKVLVVTEKAFTLQQGELLESLPLTALNDGLDQPMVGNYTMRIKDDLLVFKHIATAQKAVDRTSPKTRSPSTSPIRMNSQF